MVYLFFKKKKKKKNVDKKNTCERDLPFYSTVHFLHMYDWKFTVTCQNNTFQEAFPEVYKNQSENRSY